MKWSDVIKQIEQDRRSPDYTPDQNQETLATEIENCKAKHDHIGRLLAQRQFVDNLLTGKDLRARFYLDDMFRMIPGAVQATDWRYAPSPHERVDEYRQERYDEFRTNIKAVERSDVEEMLLQMMANIHDEQISDIFTVRDFVMNFVEHKKVTRQKLECAAAARAAHVAPKKRRKDALVPLCWGDKRYRCKICEVSSNRPDHIKKWCKDWQKHMEHGRAGVVHTNPGTYHKASDTCADCRQVMLLCGGPDVFGCVKCQIFAQTESELIEKCTAAGCPIHEHVTCHKQRIHRYEVGTDNMCPACRPRQDEPSETEQQAVGDDNMCIVCPSTGGQTESNEHDTVEDNTRVTAASAAQGQSERVQVTVPAEKTKAVKATRRSSLEVAVTKAIAEISNDIKDELQWLDDKEYQDMVDHHCIFNGEVRRLQYHRVMPNVYDNIFDGVYDSDAYDKIETTLNKIGWKTVMTPLNQAKFEETLQWQFPSEDYPDGPHPLKMLSWGCCIWTIEKVET